MAVDVPADRVARFHVRATLHGQQVETTHCFKRTTGPITAPDLLAETSRLMFAWRFAMVGQLGSDVTWREVYAKDLTPGSAIAATTLFTAGSGLLGPSLPGSIAFSLMPTGATIPRPWQWRVRLFGVPESRVVGNMLDSTWASNMRTLVRDRYTLQGAFGWAPCVLQQVVDGFPLDEGLPYPVTDYVIPSLVVSPMRRRLR